MNKYSALIKRVNSYPADVSQWDEPGLAGDVITELKNALRDREAGIEKLNAKLLETATDTTLRSGHSGWVYAGWVSKELDA